MLELLRSRLSPLRHRDYRTFFIAQTLSLTGVMAHDLARAWIVIEMLGKAAALGSLWLAIAIPSLIFILEGGVIVDRVDVRKIMIWTKILLGFACLVLTFVVETGHIEFWHLLVFGLVEGIIVAFDSPAFQALNVRMVPREDFQQALALNSTNFHAARMLGPALAGALMAWHGPSVVFLFDGLTYLLVAWIVSRLNLRPMQRASSATEKNHLTSLIDGLKYTFYSPTIRYKMLQLYLAIIIVFPCLIVVFRTYIKGKFALDAEQFGYVFTWPALGSMLGALSFTFIKPQKPLKSLFLGIPMATLTMIGLTYTNSIVLASALMSFTGFFMYLNFAALTVSMHLEVAEDYRGRMSSLIGMCFVSLGPLMSFPVGLLADSIGFEACIQLCAGLFFVLSVLLFLLNSAKNRRISRGADVTKPSVL